MFEYSELSFTNLFRLAANNPQHANWLDDFTYALTFEVLWIAFALSPELKLWPGSC